MELILTREPHTTLTFGTLKTPSFDLFTVEDVERIVNNDCSLKVDKGTAIPRGRYEIVINFSNRFQKYMPLLLEVPCFSGIRIHSGNTTADTEGCILVGSQKTQDGVIGSRLAFSKLMVLLKSFEKKEKIFIMIK